ncbi:leucine-rich repeat domain-containing protein [uncultured Brachyspira sp.]|uniref:leucine-rich repeat domain-containing protein n=1 Tax=uncultured Brachyspira sp. TaxID=221953 RepID=UPI0025DF1EB3|nr:leucine-rich repeat domain-containing protein [uncultured Brachyspira sp.]
MKKILILITVLMLLSCKNNSTNASTSQDNNNSGNAGENNDNNTTEEEKEKKDMEIILPAEIAKYAIDINTATKENIEEAIKKYAQDHNGENKVIFRGNCKKTYDGMKYGTTIAGMIRYLKLNKVIVSLEYVNFKDKKLPDNIVGGSQNYNDNIVKIIIPDDITVIGKDAVTCSKLEYINIPSNLVSIEDGAFYACKFKTLNFPNTLKKIGYFTFPICALENLTIPNSVTDIGARAFENCAKLKTIKLSDNMKVLEENLFSSCHSLQNITIPSNVKEIKRRAFDSCRSLDNITFLSANPPIIGENAFIGTVIKTIYVPKGSKSQYEQLKGKYGIEQSVNIVEL